MSFYVIIRGPLGCGKSTIAERLSKILKAKHISIDRTLDTFKVDWEGGYTSQKSFIKANKMITPEIQKSLKSGRPMIIDGNFYWKSQIDDLIKRLKTQHYVFTLRAPLEVCIARDVERGKTHGEDAARAVYKKAIEFDYGTVIDVNKPLDACVQEILSYLPSK